MGGHRLRLRDLPRPLLLGLASLIGPGQLWGAEPTPPKEPLPFVNWRALEGEELRSYREIQRAIERALGASDRAALVREVQWVVARIRTLDVAAETKAALLSGLSFRLGAAVQPLGPLVLELLKKEDKDVQLVAIDALAPASEHRSSPDAALLARLGALLEADTTHDEVRGAILWVFFLHDAFDRVRVPAERLAAGPEGRLARAAARLLCAVPAGAEFRADYVSGLFRAGAPIVRQEAALALAEFARGRMGETLTNEVTEEIVRMIGARDLPSAVRGSAIESSRHLLEDPRVLAALLDCLDRENWFSGVPDHHGPKHSLVAVVDVLADAPSPPVRSRLERLAEGLDGLDPHDRESVRASLDRALARMARSD